MSLRTILILSSLLRVGLSSGLFPSGFPTNIVCISHLADACFMPRPSNPHWFYHPSNMWWKYKLRSSSLCNFSSLQVLFLPVPLFFILIKTLFSNTLSLCSPLRLRDQVLYPYESNGNRRKSPAKRLNRFIISEVILNWNRPQGLIRKRRWWWWWIKK
jgi:hypothetical protein